MSLAGNIDALVARAATFAAFRLPGGAVQAYVQQDGHLRPPQSGQRCFVLAPFDAAESPPVCIRPEMKIDLDRPPISLVDTGRTAALTPLPVNGLNRAGYHSAVDSAVRAISDGRVEKVVLARTIEADVQGISTGALFEAAARALPDAFIALCRTDRFGLWLGASPERLLRMRDGQVEVDALAGTMPASAAPADAGAWGAKERDEQMVVKHMVMATLEDAGIADVRAEGPSVRKAGPVAHLHTRITGQPGRVDPLALARVLHPTPAVCGTPTLEAQRLIRLLEPRSRSLYAGFWGPVDEGGADLFVNIRCMELFPDRALLHAGAGITSGSVPEQECDEVERKAGTWLDLIDAQRRHG